MSNTNWKKWFGYRIRDIHIIVAYIAMSATMILPLSIARWAAVWWMVLLPINLFYGKCILTKIEMALTGENHTIIDGYLERLGKEVTNKNRKEFTIIAVIGMLIVSMARIYFMI